MRNFCALLAPVLLSAQALGAESAEPARPARARRVRAILETHCYRCHGQNGSAEGGFNYVLDLAKLSARRKVVPAQPDRSKILKRMLNDADPMPPTEEKNRPTTEEIKIVRDWIAAGAIDDRQEVERKFVSQDEIAAAIAADLDRRKERDRPFTRYFTLTHLHNAGLSDDEVQSYRHGLSKLVNSLSWGGRIVVPAPIDEAKTIFRIDLRDYQWNERTWQRIVELYPYGVEADTPSARSCAAATRCRLPYVRGDWFVAAAAQPPLYHDILQLPDTELALEKMLRVDVAENLRQERVVRAGFNSSGVSRNNRLIERHESGRVVYWKSYDFAENTGPQNLFARPLGPGKGDDQFRHDGGEIIFNLPNGLQAYLLADATGKRIDKGPTAIVSDPRRPDRRVVNGLSCMSCHAKGLIEKADQVRAHVQKNAAAFNDDDRATILALYAPRERMLELMRVDARRFQEAVAKTGAPLTATEPVAALATRFEAELDLALCSAEAGVRPDELRRALDQSPRLGKELGPLRVEGGTVQREVFVASFGELVRVLRLGKYLGANNSQLARLILEGDQFLHAGDFPAARRAFTQALQIDPRSTTALVRRGDAHRIACDFKDAVADYDRAIAMDAGLAIAWNNRGLAHNAQGDRRQALEDFAHALRIDPKLASAYYNRAGVHFARGQQRAALDDYSAAIRLEPTALSYNNRGFVHFSRGDFDRARADYDQALQLAPKFAIAFNNRGLVHSRQNQFERAREDFSAAIRLTPSFARAYFNRGVVFEKLGKPVQAKADRDQARRLDPSLDTDSD